MMKSRISNDRKFISKAKTEIRIFNFYFFFALFLAFPVFCQSQVPTAEFQIEKLNLSETGDSDATSESFRIIASDDVEKCLIDSINNIVYLITGKAKKGRFKGGGMLWAISIKEGKPLWSKFLNFSNYRFFLADTIPLLGDQFQISRLDRRTGRTMWQSHYPAASLSPNKSFVICTRGLNRIRIVSLDVNSGVILSEYKAKNIENVEDARFINDTTLLISAQGIYRISITDGTGWYYESMTTHVDRQDGYIIAGFTFGLTGITFYYFSTLDAQRRIGNLQDNYLLINDDIFLVSFDKLTHLKSDGTVKREINLPYQYVTNGLATIFDYEGTIYVVYYGRNTLGEEISTDGSAYVAAYKPGDLGWEKIYKIEGDNDEVIIDHVRSDSELTIITSNRIIKLDLKSLEQLKAEPIPGRISALGLKKILPPTTYVEIDSLFRPVIRDWPNRFLIETRDNLILEIKDDLMPSILHTSLDVFRSLGQVANFHLVRNSEHTKLIALNGTQVFNFQFSQNAHFYGNMVMDIQGNEVIWVSLPTPSKN